MRLLLLLGLFSNVGLSEEAGRILYIRGPIP